MPTTPVSVSTGIQSVTNTTIYTVPVGKTAIVKAVSGQNSTTSSVSLTVSKYSGGQNYPVVYNQPSTITPATGGTDRNNQNVLSAPLTMAAGEELKVYISTENRYSLPNVSTAGTTADDGSTYTIYASVFANGIYMAVGSCSSGVYVATSPDAITWTQRTSALPLTSRFDKLACNGSVWVAAYSDNADGTAYYSSDNGVTWTPVAVTGGTATAIKSIISNSTTFLLLTSNGRIYSSTNGSSWTQSTSYYTAVGTTGITIHNIGWTGTHWIVENLYGALASTDLTTWYGYVNPNLGRNLSAFYSTSYSSAYSKYYTTRYTSGVPNIFSSSKGFLWETLASVSGTPYKVCCAGANTVIMAVPGSSSATRWVSTNGSTFSATSDAGGYVGPVFGLDNGYFLTMQNSGTNDAYAVSTDPTASTGTTRSGTISSFSLQGAAADPVSGKWVGVGKNSTNIFRLGGSSATNVNNAVDTGYPTGTYGVPASVCWSAVDGYFYMTTDTGNVFRFTAWNGSFDLMNTATNAAGSGGGISIKAVGTTLYAVASDTPAYPDSILTSSTLLNGVTWRQYNYTAANSAAYRSVGYVQRTGMYYGEALATNGTDLVWVNHIGNAFALTPSVGTYAMRMPVPIGVGTVQVVNGNAFMYGGYNGNSFGQIWGYFTSTNPITTYGTFVSLASVSTYWANPYEPPNKVNYIGGTYYTTSTIVNSYIWKGTTPTNISQSYAGVGSTIAGVAAVNPSNGWMIDGTNLASTTNGVNLTRVCKTTTPSSYLYAGTVTASIVEID